jgi:putative membrane protein
MTPDTSHEKPDAAGPSSPSKPSGDDTRGHGPGTASPGKAPQPREQPAPPSAVATTRAAAAWFATAVALVLLVLLIVLILQNQDAVTVHYLGFTGSLPLGTALLIAAVAGAAVVTIVGVVRLTQLRLGARRARRLEAEREKKP